MPEPFRPKKLPPPPAAAAPNPPVITAAGIYDFDNVLANLPTFIEL
jgi:hypothetical protein